MKNLLLNTLFWCCSLVICTSLSAQGTCTELTMFSLIINGEPSNSQTKRTYDENGNELTSDLDSDGDGTIDFRLVRTYDENGNLLALEEDSDGDGPGGIDFRLVGTYDENGNLLTLEQDSDGDGPGAIDSRDTRTYDENGNLLTLEKDSDGDGPGTIDLRETRTYVHENCIFDENGPKSKVEEIPLMSAIQTWGLAFLILSIFLVMLDRKGVNPF